MVGERVSEKVGPFLYHAEAEFTRPLLQRGTVPLRAQELGACSAWSQEAPREEERALGFAGCHVTYLKSLRNSRGLSGAVYLPDAPRSLSTCWSPESQQPCVRLALLFSAWLLVDSPLLAPGPWHGLDVAWPRPLLGVDTSAGLSSQRCSLPT